MKNTEKRLYIISFGESRKYRLLVDSAATEGAAKKGSPLVYYEKVLNDFLAEQFPGDTYTYFTTPKVEEVYAAHLDQYADYPEFTDAALEEVKEELVREINVMNADRALNSDAPWTA